MITNFKQCTAILIVLVLMSCSKDDERVEPVYNIKTPFENSYRESGIQYYLSPTGSFDNNGLDKQHPLPSLNVVVENNYIESIDADGDTINKGALIKAGDAVLLLDGEHGDISINGYCNEKPLIIRSLNPQKAIVNSLYFRGGKNWIIQDVLFKSINTNELTNEYLLNIRDHNRLGRPSDFVVERCAFRSSSDNNNWTADDWDTKTKSGVMMDGDMLLYRNNTFSTINHGLICVGNDIYVINNNIIDFAGDAIRLNGSNMLVEANTIKNSYSVNDNHDDALQIGASIDGSTYSDIFIRRNFILESDGNEYIENINSASTNSHLQGIGSFDAHITNVVIENNIVLAKAYAGIQLNWAERCNIVNNTVYDVTNTYKARISVVPSKAVSGSIPSKNCIIENNASEVFIFEESLNTTFKNNMIISHPADLFRDWESYDFSPKNGSALIDSGCIDNIPIIDFYGNPRINGKTVDIGAIEK